MADPALIFLVGMPGAGKSYWGARIAAAHGLPFTDLDTYIEAAEHTTIPRIFEQRGEAAFRDMEHKYLMRVAAEATAVTIVATGGGTPCFRSNMAFMNNAGTTIYLQAHPYYLYRNLLRSSVVRPLLSGPGDRIDAITRLLQSREAFYKQAHHSFDAKDVSLTTFDKIISSCTSPHS